MTSLPVCGFDVTASPVPNCGIVGNDKGTSHGAKAASRERPLGDQDARPTCLLGRDFDNSYYCTVQQGSAKATAEFN